MSMCVQFVLMKASAAAIAIAIAVYRSHPFHMRFFFCSYIVCSTVVVMCGWCFSIQLLLKCSFLATAFFFQRTTKYKNNSQRMSCSLVHFHAAVQIVQLGPLLSVLEFFSSFFSFLFSSSYHVHFLQFALLIFHFSPSISRFNFSSVIFSVCVTFIFKHKISCQVTVAVSTIAFQWVYRCVCHFGYMWIHVQLFIARKKTRRPKDKIQPKAFLLYSANHAAFIRIFVRAFTPPPLPIHNNEAKKNLCVFLSLCFFLSFISFCIPFVRGNISRWSFEWEHFTTVEIHFVVLVGWIAWLLSLADCVPLLYLLTSLILVRSRVVIEWMALCKYKSIQAHSISNEIYWRFILQSAYSARTFACFSQK